MAFLKPQSPLSQGNDYFYPLTTADQVIMKGGYRLDQIAGAVEKSTIILYINGWSAEAPYSQSIVVEGLDDNVNMKMLPHFPEDFEGKQAMKEETAKISFASRSGNILTFECWDEVPTIDIPVDIEIDITYPGVPDIKINYSVVGGTEEPANPTENMIWVNTDQEITDYKLSKYEPKNSIEGMVWIYLDNTSNVYFYTLNINGREFDEVYPILAKQYVSGTWLEKTAKSYRGGEWVDWWNGELYNYGNQYESVTGGWIGMNVNKQYQAAGGELIVNESNLSFTNVSGGTFGVVINNAVDMSKYSTLHVLCKGYLKVSVADTYPYNDTDILVSITSENNYTKENELTLPIVDILGKHRIGIAHVNYTHPCYVYKVWMD